MDSNDPGKHQNRMKVNINNPSYEDYEGASHAFNPNAQIMTQIQGGQHNVGQQAQLTSIQIATQKNKQTLKESRQLNQRKPVGNSNIRTLIKSAATRD